MTDHRWRVRLAGLAAAGGFLAIALGIRVLASGDGVLDSSGTLQQHSGTALYASMVYAGVFVLVPRVAPVVAGAVAVAFCWLVELFQLTGIPAELSARSVIARLVLGVQFDATDLAWYVIGVLPLVVSHLAIDRWRRHRRNQQPTAAGTAHR
ncbi:DUF2809 domain-containing protein [Solwaraspora sp. WMMD791]|uniref:ribosomal maturation YjgA family protein n=1 Tax=Solwaraspora sp. WMMD791 TaxID=3016086 RepID=UPI002499C25E|nr:DUF2809 domain-containing protein [Solwaraspora sp. WMMD791]WFE25413.1 DUF2809 domain-containing protein [Solwaraspora sp. WMMD791]